MGNDGRGLGGVSGRSAQCQANIPNHGVLWGGGLGAGVVAISTSAGCFVEIAVVVGLVAVVGSVGDGKGCGACDGGGEGGECVDGGKLDLCVRRRAGGQLVLVLLAAITSLVEHAVEISSNRGVQRYQRWPGRVRPVSVLLAVGLTSQVQFYFLLFVSHVRPFVCRPPQPTHRSDTRLPVLVLSALSFCLSTGPRISPRRSLSASRVPPFSVSFRPIFCSLSTSAARYPPPRPLTARRFRTELPPPARYPTGAHPPPAAPHLSAPLPAPNRPRSSACDSHDSHRSLAKSGYAFRVVAPGLDTAQ